MGGKRRQPTVTVTNLEHQASTCMPSVIKSPILGPTYKAYVFLYMQLVRKRSAIFTVGAGLLQQSCPWAVLIRGLGFAGLGWVEISHFLLDRVWFGRLAKSIFLNNFTTHLTVYSGKFVALRQTK